MISDDDRREVARRLREIEPSKGGYVVWWKIAKALKLKQLDGWFGWEKFDPDSAKRLADLIEPSESGQNRDRNQDTVQKESPAVQMAPECDREALLALADKVVADTEEDVRSEDLVSAWQAGEALRDVASKIREACGEEGA